MVKSMFAAIAGLKSHQTKMDVLSNNIANVNTWGYKTKTTNFSDAMYQNMITGSGGDTTVGRQGGKNTSQLGFGTNVSSVTADYTTGSWNPTGNGWNCMINGPSFFIVGAMINGEIEMGSLSDSGLKLSRVGLFQVDNNGYIVDDQGNYVYGFTKVAGTGNPEIPATKEKQVVKNAEVNVALNADGVTYDVTIGGETYNVKSRDLKNQILDWIDLQKKNGGSAYADYEVNFDGSAYSNTGGLNGAATLTFTAKTAGAGTTWATTAATFGAGATLGEYTKGTDRVASVDAEYENTISAIQVPQGDITFNSYTIGTDGTIVGIDNNSRPYTIGKISLCVVENPNGLEQNTGYLYDIGPNAGDAVVSEAGSEAVGKILSGYLEMANVDLATEMSTMITTQRGYQANTKMITVTDEMLEQLVNMKR